MRLEGHERFVYELVSSPEVRTLASASGDQTLRLLGTGNLSERKASELD